MKILTNCGKLQVRESSIEGFGVFATDLIKQGEVLEETPFILFPRHTNVSKPLYDFLNTTKFLSDREKYIENLRSNLKFKEPEKYYFRWSPPTQLEGEPVTFTVLPLGFGPIYNSSNTDNNASWIVKDKTFVFVANRDIQKDEEIRTFYGYFLGHDGASFNTDVVYGFGFDTLEGVPHLRALRFATHEANDAAKSNPFYAKIFQLFTQSQKGLRLKKIIGAASPTEDKFTLDVSERVPLTELYNKIAESKGSIFPFIKFVFDYDAQDGKVATETIIFKK